ncbi:MAG: hypothetical protein K0R29_2095 [Pseudobdellovibrio sp.]|jgi:predicted NAD-dependent protein-ADP-ribosyltransferase YbiA (DUF1768 family)|nr:hypothetical protein [Pseudobdellovibrio sp.]
MKFVLSLSLLLSSIFGCSTAAKKVFNDGYPDLWWQEVPKSELASWEIGPQEADRSKGEVILSKRNELGKLSNFTPAPFTLDGTTYASIEGLWQSMKFPEGPKDERMKDKTIVWPFTREQVQQMTSFEAKRAGDKAGDNMKKLGIEWVTYKGKKIDYKGTEKEVFYDIIFRASRAKLESNPDIKALLLRTKTLKLLPDHHQKPTDPPSYRYYEIYMKLREEYLAQGLSASLKF